MFTAAAQVRRPLLLGNFRLGKHVGHNIFCSVDLIFGSGPRDCRAFVGIIKEDKRVCPAKGNFDCVFRVWMRVERPLFVHEKATE